MFASEGPKQIPPPISPAPTSIKWPLPNAFRITANVLINVQLYNINTFFVGCLHKMTQHLNIYVFIYYSKRKLVPFQCPLKEQTPSDTASSSSVPTPCCHSLTLWDWISGSWTTFGWLQDVLYTRVHGVLIL